jgi:hypothetical protein
MEGLGPVGGRARRLPALYGVAQPFWICRARRACARESTLFGNARNLIVNEAKIGERNAVSFGLTRKQEEYACVRRPSAVGLLTIKRTPSGKTAFNLAL